MDYCRPLPGGMGHFRRSPDAADAVAAHEAAVALRIGDLRCEYLCDPLGIDILSAKTRLDSLVPQRGQKQTAYQVLVASTPELLSHDNGDLWDSGRVESDQSTQLDYAGKPLASRLRCFWKVRAWDEDWQTHRLERTGTVDDGPAERKDWQAAWITESTAKDVGVDGGAWIWYPHPQPVEETPPGVCRFRTHLNISPRCGNPRCVGRHGRSYRFLPPDQR